VSPTFHAFYDDKFKTVNPITNQYIQTLHWQVKCGFQKETAIIRLENQKHNIESTTSDVREDNEDQNEMPIMPWDSTNEENLQSSTTNQINDDQFSDNIITTTRANDNNTTVINVQPQQYVTSSGRTVKQPDRYGNYVAYQVEPSPSIYEPSLEYTNPISMMSSSDPDTMYYHEISQQNDKNEFMNAMEFEINNHTTKRHWVLTKRCTIPNDA
jgi:hypothetical protein